MAIACGEIYVWFVVYCWVQILQCGQQFYLRLKIEKMHAFAVLTAVVSYGCSGANFTAAVNCAIPKTEIQNEVKYNLTTNINIQNANLVCN